MYILFFSALSRELNEPVRARKRAELTMWLVNLMSRAELARYPPLDGNRAGRIVVLENKFVACESVHET
jgi:hypothetical protein